jgi:hypothetical protein
LSYQIKSVYWLRSCYGSQILAMASGRQQAAADGRQAVEFLTLSICSVLFFSQFPMLFRYLQLKCAYYDFNFHDRALNRRIRIHRNRNRNAQRNRNSQLNCNFN